MSERTRVLARRERTTEHSHSHDHGDAQHISDLTSVGVDIGSATTHLAVAQLRIGKRDPRIVGKPEVLERRLVGESSILLTPFLADGRIDADALESFVRSEIAALGLDLPDIDTGAVICTGEAARRENAAAITDRVSSISGDFVCAIAGHRAEAILGAHGSGALHASRETLTPIVLLDVGGGTAKRSVLSGGRILDTAALNVGARLLAMEDDVIVRAEPAVQAIGRDIGLNLQVGLTLSPDDSRALVGRMAETLLQFLGFADQEALTRQLFLTDPPSPLPDAPLIGITGGLAEYYFGRDTHDTGDLGRDLALALRDRLEAVVDREQVIDPGEGIRATALGAGQFSVQLSGETVFLEGGLEPPIRGVPVRSVELDWSALSPEQVDDTVARALHDEHGGPVALAFDAADAHGYADARRLARSLARALERLRPSDGVVVVLSNNLAQTVGQVLLTADMGVPFMCLDELDVNDLDFLDIGRPVRDDTFLPIVVKTLVFQRPAEPFSGQ